MNEVALRCQVSDEEWNWEWQYSGGGEYGVWDTRYLQECPGGKKICGVNIRFEEDQGSGGVRKGVLYNDDTAMNGIKLTCC